MNVARALAAGTGTQTAAMVSHGTPNPNTSSEEYNGTNWTSGGTTGTARYNVGAGGTSTASVAFGGNSGSTATEDYNGSSWTAGNPINTGRGFYNGGDGAASSLVFAIAGDGPSVPDSNLVEQYNGTTWITQATIATGRRSGAAGAGGTSGNTLFFGGRDGGSDQSGTEEFTGESTTTNVEIITTS